jgi:hypothetical protein
LAGHYAARGQTAINGSRVVAGYWDATNATWTKPAKSGTAVPATCTAGEQFFKTDAAAGQNLYFCTATNVWTQMAGASGAGAPTSAKYILQTADGSLPNAQALGALGSGVLKSTAGTGVVSIATGADLPAHTHGAAEVASGTLAPARGGTGADLSGSGGAGQVLKQSAPGAAVSVGTLASSDLSDGAALERTARRNAADGYAGLDAAGRIARAQAAAGTAYTDTNNTFTAGTVDMSAAGATLPVKAGAGAAAPATCAANKELYIKTDATAGQQLFICNATGNGWNLVGDGGGGGGGSQEKAFRAAVCQEGLPSLGFSSPSSNPAAAACVAGTSTTVVGVAQFTDASSQSVQDHFTLPGSFSSVALRVYWRTSATTGTAVWQVQTACVGDGETVDPAWNPAQEIADAAKGTANQVNGATLASVTTTGCGADEELFFQLFRDPGHAGDNLGATAELLSVKFSIQ